MLNNDCVAAVYLLIFVCPTVRFVKIRFMDGGGGGHPCLVSSNLCCNAFVFMHFFAPFLSSLQQKISMNSVY